MASYECEETGRMKYNSKKWYLSKTYHGYGTGIIKSALQKNIRRGNMGQSIFCTYELYAFKYVGGMPVVHNLYNRLTVIACEDVSPRNIALAAYVCGWNVNWMRKSKLDWLPSNKSSIKSSSGSSPSGSSPGMKNEDPYDLCRILAITTMLCGSTKSRISSHLWHAYTTELGRFELQKRGMIVDTLNPVIYIPLDDLSFPSRLKGSVSYLLESDYTLENGKLAYTAILIHDKLLKRDPNAVAWIDYYLRSFSSLKVKTRHSRRKSDIILWEIFISLGVPKDIIRPLRDAYFNIGENNPILMVVVSYILYNDGSESLDMTKISKSVDSIRHNTMESNILDSIVSHNYDLIIEDYMHDMHTGARGTPQELRRKFVQHGAHIENPDSVAFDPMLKDIYELDIPEGPPGPANVSSLDTEDDH